jgi:hypothetical protein
MINVKFYLFQTKNAFSALLFQHFLIAILINTVPFSEMIGPLGLLRFVWVASAPIAASFESLSFMHVAIRV